MSKRWKELPAEVSRGVLLERLSRVEEILEEQLDRTRAARLISREFRITVRQARRYVRAVRKQWAIEAVGDRRLTRREEIRRGYLAIYRRAMETGQLKAATQALRGLSDLDGLNAPHEHVLMPAPVPIDLRADNVTNLKDAARRLKARNE